MVLVRFSSGVLTPVVALVTVVSVVSVVTVVRTVRFPESLYERLRETPRGRSLNAEIVARLEASFGGLGSVPTVAQDSARTSRAPVGALPVVPGDGGHVEFEDDGWVETPNEPFEESP